MPFNRRLHRLFLYELMEKLEDRWWVGHSSYSKERDARSRAEKSGLEVVIGTEWGPGMDLRKWRARLSFRREDQSE
jgi:hypothetical protein